MSTPRILVLRTAGTNCDREAVHACELVGAEVDLLHVAALLDRPARLQSYHMLLLPGGFSYGDDLGGGRILANELRYRLGDAVREFVADGKLVLGICNGFQVLVKAGLLPGGRDGRPKVTLAHNDSGRFEDRWVHLEVTSDASIFLDRGERLFLPVAHAEGKLVAKDDATLADIREHGRDVLRYVAPDGSPAAYPDNPNGSAADIAGLADETGRILGLMPHPERHVYRTQHPFWTRLGDPSEPGDGLRIFRRAVDRARAEVV